MKRSNRVLSFVATVSFIVMILTCAKADVPNEDATLRHLGPFAFYSQTPVRLYVLGNYDRRSGMQFPVVKSEPPSKSATGVSAVREMFRHDKNVHVTEDHGIIRVRIGSVSTELLRTKITKVVFDREVRYDPSQALGVIISTKEVQAAMQTRRLTPPWSLGGTAVVPESNWPHLPPSISNVTLEEAVDTIAKTWGGRIIVIYVVCAQPKDTGERLFDFGIYGQIGPR